MANQKLLTFEIADDGRRVEIHCDREGLAQMIVALQALARKAPPDHDHWQTPAWAGDELTQTKQGASNTLINNVKIFVWR